MADDGYIQIKIENEERVIQSLRSIEARLRTNLRNLVDDIADNASVALVGQVPQGKNYILNHINRAGPVWMPGGAGGGGEWKAIVGISKGTSEHPLYVEYGTGIYAGRGQIFPSKPWGVIAFRKKGEEQGRAIFRQWIWGQPGQYYFYNTWRWLNIYAAERILREHLT